MQFLQHLGGRGSLNCFPTFMQRSDSVLWGASLPTWQVAMSCFPRRGSAKLRPPPKTSPQGSLSFAPDSLASKLAVELRLSELRPPALCAPGLRPSELGRYISLTGSGASTHSLHRLHPNPDIRANPPERARSSSPRLSRSGSLTSAHSLQLACSRCRFLFVFFSLSRGRVNSYA